MTTRDDAVDGRAAELRRAFDRSFAELPRREVVRGESLLAIGIGGEPLAIRLRDVAGLFADKAITPVPSSFSELAGVAGFRGAIVPVYDLRMLLGHPPGGPLRWVMLLTMPVKPDARPSQPIALAFEAFDGHLQVLPGAIAANGLVETVRDGGITRAIVDVASIFESITRRVKPQLSQRDR